MSYQLRIRCTAEADIQEAYEYYEECRHGLGQDFILCLEASLDKIIKNPNHYPIIHRNIHRILVKRFPFGIFFIVKENTIVVLAVMHGSRSPRRWKVRV